MRVLFEQELPLPPGHSLKSETSRSGLRTASLKLADGKVINLHSRYDPMQEGTQLVKDTGEENSFIVLGFGLGYHVDALVKKIPPEQIATSILIIEPNAWMLQFALKNRDISHLLSDSRITWCIGLPQEEIGTIWQQELEWSRLSGVKIIEHPPSSVFNSVYFKQVKEKIIVISRRSKGNLATLMTMGDEFQRNSFENLPFLCCCPGMIELFDRFKGHPIIVVAAGPSLEKNVHLLNEIKGRVLILAVDTAFRQLVAHGIRPDIVAAADPSYENSLDFVGVENEREVILAAEIMTHPTIFQFFKGPKCVLSFGGGLMPWAKAFIEPKGIIQCWGSIATTIFDIARKLGGDPIIFLGLDLAFQDGLLHARGSYSDDVLFEQLHQYTSLEHQITSYINTRGAVKSVNYLGETLYTDKSMQLYKEWFEDQFQQTSQRVVNASEGGIVDRNVIRM
ncbi:motility associated factor glycosyltransferase family protein, partial [bacterium]|nr:motility associated factor glycosyltransferase family protein [bacterium]